uniref:Uncharacterized protein n=1 Tax=Strombidium rassoulzadegani TaxID=1082188 RepID=A0A7S3FXC5_9SPIT|mmetsp:Transcript_6624/g.11151  ORF Transcript_6624/g.11151 Transcript_6624/m.11151 type:complete len:184 (+) Transcript_6624:719-1270(+)
MNDSVMGRRIFLAEQKFVDKVDPFTENIALNVFNYEEEDYHLFLFKMLKVVTGIYMGFTLLISISRPDFLNTSICFLAIYQLSNIDELRKHVFRLLVVGVAISFVYDFAWLNLLWTEYEEDLAESSELGKVEMGIKQFSLYLSFLSLIFRVIVFAAYWRASIDFKSIVKDSRFNFNHDIDNLQ